MGLGNRCDEIVRMIDDTLEQVRTPRPLRRRRADDDPAAGEWPVSTRVETPRPGPRAA